MSVPYELEKAATAYALDAVRLDKQGQKGRAIKLYQKAIETLLHLVQLYPKSGLNKAYVHRAVAYEERVKILQGTVMSHDFHQESNNYDCEPEYRWNPISDYNQLVRIREPFVDDGDECKRLTFMVFTQSGPLECTLNVLIKKPHISCILTTPLSNSAVDVYDVFNNIFRECSFDNEPIHALDSENMLCSKLTAKWCFRKDDLMALLDIMYSTLGYDWWKVFQSIT